MKASWKIVAAVVCLVVATSSLEAARPAKAVEGRRKAIDLLADGQTYEKNKQYDEAYQCYTQSVQLAPSPAAYYHLGKLARVRGAHTEARTYLEHALKLNPDYELAKLELGQVGSSGGASAQTVLVEADAPMNVEKLRSEMVTVQSMARPTIDNSADPAVVSNALLGNPEPSTPNFTAPGDAPARRSLEPQQAAVQVNESVWRTSSPGIEPTDPASVESREALSEAGTVLAADGSVPDDDALPSRDAINAAAFGPESQQQESSIGYGETTKVALGTFAFHKEKGDSFRESNRWREAAVEYEWALRVDPDNVEVRTLRAEALARAGQVADANEEFEDVKAIAPDEALVYYKQGNAYYDEEQYDQAIGSYRQAIALEPENKFAQNNLGVVYMEKKNYKAAVDQFSKTLKLDPKYDMAVLNLGIIYDEHLVDKKKALGYYERYIDLNGPRRTEVERWADAIRSQMPADTTETTATSGETGE